ncbi:MAG TPA: hypothetical protein PLD38_08100 [Pyrinomonadaceae bacterium]|nr:hypothetical protein [Chloracidobacterium sp.]MBK9437719.1 hypothetical protein [Chloracidobacterium sp.]MBL0239682.1 hypothetical protein [Chloracidobacterium sp.]HQY67227.1 hypothetical protein [Pyrinomonadaceae bacterium]
MRYFILIAVLIFTYSIAVQAQPRPIGTSTATAKAAPAPESFGAKYEGGLFGFNNKQIGTLKFDDANDRLVFFGNEQKELFGIPYDALLVIYPQSKSVTSTTGNVLRNIPLPGAALAGFIKEKRSYLIIQCDDPDIDVKGVVNFKLESKELLDAVLRSLADRAHLTQRGDAFYRPKAAKSTDPN